VKKRVFSSLLFQKQQAAAGGVGEKIRREGCAYHASLVIQGAARCASLSSAAVFVRVHFDARSKSSVRGTGCWSHSEIWARPPQQNVGLRGERRRG
jgi:hypothetical protein